MNNNRILSIDVFRSVTMVLMIWVNDFWTLSSIPKWLKHASADEDYLGFSDVIFPWFLFAMASGLLVYPAYMISKKNNTLVRVLYSLIGILVFFSAFRIS